MPKWTDEQKEAIYKEGTNIIVSAGAGSGKTAVLTERVLEKVKKGISVDNLLILTFTKMAAKEMRERIGEKLKENGLLDDSYKEDVMEQVEISIKYAGYISKVNKEAEKMLRQEEKQIPKDIDYQLIPNLASEARQKLSKVNPTTIGQALRISGVNPADISILLIYLRKRYHE